MEDEAGEGTPPVRQNRCLVSKCVIEHGALSPYEHMAETEEKVPQDILMDDQELHPLVEDEVVELHAGTEEF